MTQPTSENLAKALMEVDLYGMAQLARLDHYHDVRSKMPHPSIELNQDLLREAALTKQQRHKDAIEALRVRCINGEFAASTEEVSDWRHEQEWADDD